jgi:ketosteroid isomerase-like protein
VRAAVATAFLCGVLELQACGSDPGPATSAALDSAAVAAEAEAAVWAFHAADTARDAQAVLDLLWPDYEMLVDGQWTDYEGIARSSPEFMASLELFHTVWSDVRVIPVGPDAALASFQFRDSIVSLDGEVTRARGPTTFLWERREGEWRLRFGDADHYPVTE